MLNYQWLKSLRHRLSYITRRLEISRVECSGVPWFQGWLPCKSFGFSSWFQDGCPDPALSCPHKTLSQRRKAWGREMEMIFLLTRLSWRKSFPGLPSRLLIITHSAKLSHTSTSEAISGKGERGHHIWPWPVMTPLPRLDLPFPATVPLGKWIIQDFCYQEKK